MKRLIMVSMAVFLATDAYALDPYMWGVGPRIGTMVLPGEYPILLPVQIRDDPSGIEKVDGDVNFGIDAVYYINGGSRAHTMGTLGLGKGYFDANWQIGYQGKMVGGAIDLLFGGSAGVGYAQFSGDNDASFQMPYYPIRLDLTAQIRDTTRAYQFAIFGQYNIPGKQVFINSAGVEAQPDWGFNMHMGIELVLYFGDFEPPAPRKRRSPTTTAPPPTTE